MVDWNNTSLAERKRLVAEASKGTTFHRMAQVDPDENPGGRFGGASLVSGSAPTTNYPPIDEGPWGSGPQPGLEPGLGVEIDHMEPVGNFHEVQRSIEAQSTKEATTPSLAEVDPALASDAPSSVRPMAGEVEIAARANPLVRRRRVT